MKLSLDEKVLERFDRIIALLSSIDIQIKTANAMSQEFLGDIAEMKGIKKSDT